MQMTQLKLDFQVDRVKLEITQETVQVRDQGLFDFEIRSITTRAVIKDHENEFNFKIEDMTARYAQQGSLINFIFISARANFKVALLENPADGVVKASSSDVRTPPCL